MNYCLFSRSIIKHDNGLLQFTRARLITIYDSLVITIYDDCYYNSQQNRAPERLNFSSLDRRCFALCIASTAFQNALEYFTAPNK